jgi:hypothetical protein
MMMPNRLISGTISTFYGSGHGQWRAKRDGIAGIPGIPRKVGSVTYRI